MKRIVTIFKTACLILLLNQCSVAQNNDRSTKSKIIYNTLKSLDLAENTFNRLLSHPKRGTNRVVAAKISRKLQVVEKVIDGHNVLTVSSSAATKKHIIFLHGGAYMAEAIRVHRLLIEKLALKYDFKVSFIDYPLAPEYGAVTTLDVVEKAYNEIARENPDDTLLLLGDSAGGGLALSLLQIIQRKRHSRMPEKTVLLSPWLDISMSNPTILEYVDKDVLLSLEGLQACGKLYANGLDLKDPLVSPLYGNLENLSQVRIYVSDHELFYPDCMLLKDKTGKAKGTTASFMVKKRMVHDWILLPIPEAEEAVQEITQYFMAN